MALEKTDLVLVTGAAGFIGRDLVAYLLERGQRVKAFVRPARARDLPASDRLVIATGDLRDRDALALALAGVRAVAHLAARKSDEPDSVEVNVGGAEALVEVCRACGIRRLVNVSTQSVKLPRRGVLAERLAAWGVRPGAIVAPFNPRGYLMNPSPEDCERALKESDVEVIASHIEVDGLIGRQEALDYLRGLSIHRGIVELGR